MSVVLSLVQSSPITVAAITVSTATGIVVGSRLSITGYTAGNAAANGVYIVLTVSGTNLTASRADNANTINTTGTGAFVILGNVIVTDNAIYSITKRRAGGEVIVPVIPGSGGGGGGGSSGTRSSAFGF